MTSRVCAVHGCPNPQPCPDHPGRPRNATWTRDRPRAAQHAFRTAVLARDNHTCRRCGHHDPTGKTLVAHHDRPGYTPDCGRTLCQPCHRKVDTHAR